MTTTLRVAAGASAPSSLLFVDDDPLFADCAADVLRERGFDVQTASSLQVANDLDPGSYDAIVLDHQLPDGSGLELLRGVDCSRTRVVVVSASPRAESEVDALPFDVAAFLLKPFDLSALVAVLRDPAARRLPAPRPPRAPQQVELLPSLRPHEARLAAFAHARCPVLIGGETGTGKGFLVRYLHDRRDPARPLVSVNCAAIPPTLFESELFGAERGAFTGAEARPGLIERAHGGTLFLDEVGELPPALQAKLLGFLDDGTVRRVGGLRERVVDVRVVAATNVDLEDAVREKRFRIDLFHRLDVASFSLSPLRQRREDIPPLVEQRLGVMGERDGTRYELGRGEVERLQRHAWPGNVRELFASLERSALLDRPRALTPASHLRSVVALPFPGAEASVAAAAPHRPGGEARSTARGSERPKTLALDAVEREHVMSVLAMFDDNRLRAAQALGIGVATLRRKLKQWKVPA